MNKINLNEIISVDKIQKCVLQFVSNLSLAKDEDGNYDFSAVVDIDTLNNIERDIFYKILKKINNAIDCIDEDYE